ncbi:MAG: tRNA (adenosine(37)-N6)-dimethylallyltransferase MiaA, partial [Firmicutes bacterium]|nr:tRNA (adenosine(37)-N6)-dimethylallyltransferase MiaA [Bacillota bacterium]
SDIDSETKDYDIILIGLTRDRAELYDRVNRRVDILMNEGLLDEVKGLMDMGLTQENISMKGIGYKELMDHLDGRCTVDDAVDTVKKNTRHYAKKQLTWFRRYEKMKWFDISGYDNDEDAFEDMKEWLLKNK